LSNSAIIARAMKLNTILIVSPAAQSTPIFANSTAREETA